MAIIFEDSAKVTNRKIPIPKNAQKTFSTLYNALEPLVGKPKLKNLKNLATSKTYNKKGVDSKTNGDDKKTKYIDVDVAKKRKERFPTDPLQKMMQGGQLAYDIYDKGINRARSQEKVSPVEPPKPTTKAVEPPTVKQKELETPNGTIKFNEARIINEDSDEHPFYDYLEDYDETYVFNEFLSNPNGKQSWGVLINPSMYKRALTMFTKYGNLATFPEKYVYQWMGIIMKNTAILIANTNIAGHSRYFPMDDFEDFLHEYFKDREISFNDDDEILIEITPQDVIKMCNGETIVENIVDRHGQTYLPFVSHGEIQRITHKQDVDRMKDSLGDIAEYIAQYNEENWDRIEIDKETGKLVWRIEYLNLVDKIGIYDWMSMPDGSDAWSDFGISPLEKIISEYNEDLSPERVLVIVNKALDVVHCRGDMSSIFIQGGERSLDMIAEERKKKNGKKVYINENQLIKLKYGKYIKHDVK